MSMLMRRAFLGGDINVNPPFADVTLLLHMDGTNGGTTFTDSSSNGYTMSRSGVTTSTSVVKYGSASANFTSGGSNYLFINSIGVVGSGTPFTMEGWFYFTTANTSRRIFSLDAATRLIVDINSSGYLRLAVAGGTGSPVAAVSAPTQNTWHHIAVVRDSSNVVTLYFNGSPIGTISYGGGIDNSLVLGRIATNASMVGYIDDFRFVDSLAVYTSAFTPPTAAFPNS